MTYDTPEAPHADLKLCLAKGTHCYAALEKVHPSLHMVILFESTNYYSKRLKAGRLVILL